MITQASFMPYIGVHVQLDNDTQACVTTNTMSYYLFHTWSCSPPQWCRKIAKYYVFNSIQDTSISTVKTPRSVIQMVKIVNLLQLVSMHRATVNEHTNIIILLCPMYSFCKSLACSSSSRSVVGVWRAREHAVKRHTSVCSSKLKFYNSFITHNIIQEVLIP